MEFVPLPQQAKIASLFAATQQNISDGIVASTLHEITRLFNAWSSWMSACFPLLPSDLQGIPRPQQLDLLAAYARHVRLDGISRRSANVCAQTVQIALRSISTSLQLAGKQNPLRDQEGKYPKAIQQLLEGYRRADPPPQPKLAVPVLVPNYMSQMGSIHHCPKEQAIGDLSLIAFYYLL